jgi:uncharacterized membrane protein YgdD (TMEM256/DUF423 family)
MDTSASKQERHEKTRHEKVASEKVAHEFVNKMPKQTKIAVLFGAVYLCLGIILGAFAAHGLKAPLNEYQMAVLQTGVKYQLIHGLALIVLGLLYSIYRKRLFYIASICIIMGVFLFSFSLYAIALLSLSGLGLVTPIGGVFMIVAWLITMYAVVKD